MTAPALRTVTADDEVLDALADRHGPGDMPFAAAALSWPGWTLEGAQAAWTEFADARFWQVALRPPAARGWFERYDEAAIPPGDLQAEAWQMARAEADERRRYFRSGDARTSAVAGAGS